MKYEADIIKGIVDSRGHEMSSIHYKSECVEEWVKEVEGAYPKLCDYQPEWLNYAYNNPIGEFPYVTLTNVTNATVENVVPYAYKSAILKGQTVDNIVDFGEGFTITNGAKDFNFLFPPKLNKEYRLIVELSNVTPALGTQDYICIRGVRADGSYEELARLTQSYNNGSYEIPCVFTKDYAKFRIAIRFTATVQAKLKGELINCKMPVLTTTGKNLFNKTKVKYNTGINMSGIEFTDSNANKYVSSDFIEVKENTFYYIQGMPVVMSYDKNKEFLNITRNASTNGSFTTPNGCKYIRIRNWAHLDTLELQKEIVNITQLEEGSIVTSYEPYKSNILTVNEDVTLRGIGDVQDTLDCLTGEVTERIVEVVLDGSDDENWILGTTKANTQVFELKISNVQSTHNTAISDKLPTGASGDVEKIAYGNSTGSGSNTSLYIALLKTKASTVVELRTYLTSNPIVVQYPLEKESIKTVDLMITNQNGESLSKISPIEGTMRLSTSSDTIPPLFSGEIPVEAITQNLESFIDEE